jgi:hypothetical protein
MTTGTNPEPSPHPSALAQLDLQPNTPADEARRKLLKQLGEMDFMPPVGWDSALRVSRIAAGGGDQSGPASVPARRAAEEALRAEVEDFAAKFFSLAPHVRTAQYQDLAKRCASVPAVVGRLETLSPALELASELPSGQSPEVTELLEQTVRLFVLPRQERAAQRWCFMRHCQADLATWREAAAAVRREHVRYAALEPTLIGELSLPLNRERLRAKLARRRKAQVRRSRVSKWLFGSERERIAWTVITALILGGTLSYFKEDRKSRQEGFVPQPSQRSQVQKANEEMNKFVNDALREGKPIPEAIRRLYGLPPQKESSPPSTLAPSLTQLVEIRIAKTMEEAQEMLRQLQAQPPQTASSRRQVHVFNLEGAREKLRQLREQQAESDPDPLRDAMIAGLEKAIKEASPNSQN